MFETRRYLTHFHASRTPHILTDVLVIGAGIAGLRAALAAARHCQVLLICKAGLLDSNTRFAQGGIAVACDSAESREAHLADTLQVGCGLSDEKMARLMVEQGPIRIQELMDWGVRFDREQDRLALTREGGHSQDRVIHADGDATGLAVSQALIHSVKSEPAIRVFEHCYVIDLLTVEGQCTGVVTYHEKHGHQLIWAKQIILASGGCGRLYRETTNPEVATGDGHAMAFRAGASLQDMEFVQFHPTTLYIAGASRALISEAVRGEGGKLVDKAGERFMDRHHPQAELAPRDVVSRAILDHLGQTRSNCVYLDVRHMKAGGFAARFPGIFRLCRDFGIDVEKDLIPVRPSAHYMIGGVSVDERGRSTLPGLLACGEAAASGVHGANRLASNSLLEGLVFGAESGDEAGAVAAAKSGPASPRTVEHEPKISERTGLDLDDVARSLKSLMWRNAGILRNGPRLSETVEIINMWSKYVLDKLLDAPFGWEVQNMLTTSLLVSVAALQRRESRGVHYRTDHPRPDDAAWKSHLRIQRQDGELQLFQAQVDQGAAG